VIKQTRFQLMNFPRCVMYQAFTMELAWIEIYKFFIDIYFATHSWCSWVTWYNEVQACQRHTLFILQSLL